MKYYINANYATTRKVIVSEAEKANSFITDWIYIGTFASEAEARAQYAEPWERA